ncbi:hypothetical protein A8H35_08430 [Burkholderia thailandensis]|uniref:Uncharacterized protein n=1 Tax=Burkholderia thailandensis (strain ATCC 700388 / DSM 13276 / CCUG 48851 / CIP 106301 / E264) TaxID=271848 RepID=Q2SUE6_BURTA|nr:hypothetical protein BTH_I2946 [Burkholderia thailandensis E264]AVR08828.1 hypothetical protein A8H31_14950 [Burkholderia thailandensis]AWY58452.1 hypothetical protein A8H35_08430 [Burkholderia thailandensis]AWY67384.1 hypothetical protein A8H36_20000 [Burkholderia thailandensis]NOK54185.1 hypothetical protein [Burkholderia thailandensis]
MLEEGACSFRVDAPLERHFRRGGENKNGPPVGGPHGAHRNVRRRFVFSVVACSTTTDDAGGDVREPLIPSAVAAA